MQHYRVMAAILVAAGSMACDGTEVTVNTYVAAMTGLSETPAVITTATGSATVIDTEGLITFVVTVNGLSGPPTMAHIHAGAAGVAGPIVYTFNLTAVATGTIASGALLAASLTIGADSLVALLVSGSAYVNVHTAANAGGEVRGQLALQ